MRRRLRREEGGDGKVSAGTESLRISKLRMQSLAAAVFPMGYVLKYGLVSREFRPKPAPKPS
jgi:hypothetical protein